MYERSARESNDVSELYELYIGRLADEIESSNREDVNPVGSRDGDIECLIKVLSSNHLS